MSGVHGGYTSKLIDYSPQFIDVVFTSLNLGLEKNFAFRGYLWAARIEAANMFDRLNPGSVVNNVDAPNFGSFAGG